MRINRKQGSENSRRKRSKDSERTEFEEFTEMSSVNTDAAGTGTFKHDEDGNYIEADGFHNSKGCDEQEEYRKCGQKKDKYKHDCCEVCCKYKDDNCDFVCDSHRELLLRIICLLIDKEYGLKAIEQKLRASQQKDDINNIKSITRLLEEAIVGLGETAVGAVKKAVEAAGTITDITEGLAKIAAGAAGTAGSLALASSGAANVVAGTALTASASANTVAASANVVAGTALTASAAANTVAASANVVADTALTASAAANTVAGTAGAASGIAETTAAVTHIAAGAAGTASGIAETASGVVNTVAGAAGVAAGAAGTAAGIADTTAGVAGVAAGAAGTAAAIADTTAAVAGTAAAVAQTAAGVAGVAAGAAGTAAGIADTTAAVAGTVAAISETTAAAAGTTISAVQTTDGETDDAATESNGLFDENSLEEGETEGIASEEAADPEVSGSKASKNISDGEPIFNETDEERNASPQNIFLHMAAVTTGPVMLDSGADTIQVRVLNNNYTQIDTVNVLVYDLTCTPKACFSIQSEVIPANSCNLFTIRKAPVVYEVQIQGVKRNVFASAVSCNETSGLIGAANTYRSSDLMPVGIE